MLLVFGIMIAINLESATKKPLLMPSIAEEKVQSAKFFKKRKPKVQDTAISNVEQVFDFSLLAVSFAELQKNPHDLRLRAVVAEERNKFNSNPILYNNIKAINDYQKALGMI